MQAQVETETIALSCGIETGQRKDAILNVSVVHVVVMLRPQRFDEPITFEARLGEDAAYRLANEGLELWSRELGQWPVRQELIEADHRLSRA